VKHNENLAISHTAIKLTVTQGLITSIQLNLTSKPEFCEPCAKAKLAWQPFPKESKTQAMKYSEWVHWDLWGPATVKSLNGNFYIAACINDATWETVLYFQAKKSKIFESYKRDEAFIETQSGNRIKTVCSDWGGEFQCNKSAPGQEGYNQRIHHLRTEQQKEACKHLLNMLECS